jgi:hypothetical protein
VICASCRCRLEAELARQQAAESGLSDSDYVVLVALTDRPQGRLRRFELGAILGGKGAAFRTMSRAWWIEDS